MQTGNWPIRSKIIALVALPIAALLALWIFATTLTVGPASGLLAAQTLLDEVGRPGEKVVAELQRERRLTMIYLAGRNNAAELGDQRIRTDQAIADFRDRTSTPALRDTADDLIGERLDQMLAAVDALPAGRGFIDRRDMDRVGALSLYSGMIDTAFRTFSVIIALPDEDLARDARTLTAFGRAREVLAQSDALLAGVLTAGQFAPGEHAQLVQIIGTQRFLYAEAVADLPDADHAAYQQLIEGDSFVRLRAVEEELVVKGRTGAAPPAKARDWQSDYEQVQQQLRDFELAGADALAERSVPVAVGILVRLGLAGVLGFLAVLLSAILALRVGRSLIRRLTGLRAAALTLAGERLPSVVERLRRGEEVDVDREAPPLDFGTDEIGQVGQAFSEVQRTAVRSAVEQAALRRGLSEVFLNIARRSQTLLHRQLALLDRMERRSTEPEELADLFRVDHMATRMRRHAEDLVVLAGASPGRGWRNPIPVVDVIRGAISEVEEYARVDIMVVQPVDIAGRAVGDVIHLLAELIENATSFSPPHTRVQIVGQVVPNGYVIEIEDRGLGMLPEAIDNVNQRLTEPLDFDPANSARLGLFVVARLSARHGVKVQLRPSPYGGVTAVTLVPGELVSPRTGPLALPGRTAAPVGPAATAGPGPLPVGAATGAVPGDRRAAAVLQAARRLDGPEAATQVLPVIVPAKPAEIPVGPDGLPRRVRQSSLTPQLRESAPGATRTGGGAAGDIPRAGVALDGDFVDEPSARSPEEVRAVMSALQAGTARGRQDADPPAGSDADPPPPADPEASPVADLGSADSERDA